MNNSPIPLFGKISSDSVPNRQPENTVVYTLNQVVRNNSLVTEYGTELIVELDEGFIKIAEYYISNNRVVIFATNTIIDTIGIFDGIVYTEHVRCNLDFNINYYIDCTYRLRNGCEDVIYFTDGLNPVRFYNFSKPDIFKTAGEFDKNKFALSRVFKKPEFTNIKIINSNGKIKIGAIIFAIDYLDNDLNPTPILNSTHPVLIYPGSASSIYGQYNEEYSNKSAKVYLNNLDADFKFYRIYICSIDNRTSKISYIKRTEPINIDQPVFEYNNLQFLEDIPITSLYYVGSLPERALAIDQIDNTLLLANTKNEYIDAATHQKLASKIGVVASVKKVDKANKENIYHPNNPNYLQVASHMADEVISLGITFVNSQTGKESGPYHIPGRTVDKNPFNCTNLEYRLDYEYRHILFYFTYSIREASKIEIKYTIRDFNTVTEHTKIISLYRQYPEIITHEIIINSVKQFTLISIKEIDLSGTPDYTKYTIEFSTSKVTNNNIDIFNGWDTSVITRVTPNFEPFGIYSISVLLPHYYDFYNNGNSIPYDEAKFKRTDFLEYLKTKIVSKDLDYPLRWELYNTSKYIDDGKLLLGYYENKNSYYNNPLNSECIDDYWGVDICGVPLTNKNIRHHRMPDRSLVHIEDDFNFYLLGLEFFNIEYPTGYDSHYFSCGTKTENDKTVIDTGITSRQIHGKLSNVKGSAYLFNHYAVNPDLYTADVAFYSPKIMLNQHSPSGYLKRYFNYTDLGYDNSPTYTALGGLEYQEVSQFTGADDLGIAFCMFKPIPDYSKPINNIYNYSIKSTYNVPIINAISTENKTIKNSSNANRLFYIERDNDDKNIYFTYSSIKQLKDVYSNLDLIKYRKLHTNLLTINDSQIVFGGDTYITKFSLVNYALQTFEADNTGPALSAFLIALNAASAIATAGASLALTATIGGAILATGVTQALYDNYLTEAKFNTFGYITNHKYKSFFHDGGDGIIGYIFEIMDGPYIDSYINWEARLDGEDDPLKVLRDSAIQNNGALVGRDIQRYIKHKFLTAPKTDEEKDNAGDNGLILRPIIPPEYYNANPDFIPLLTIQDVYGIPSTYNHCSKCKEEFTDRIHYSLQSFQEELADNYRIFLPNNYKDVNGEFGPIVDIFKKNNKLYISTLESLLIQPSNYQEKIIGEVVAYVGTGSYFELPTQELISSASGRVGNINRQSTLNIPDGILVIDLLHLKIWFVGNNDILNLTSEEYGYKIWLEENMDIKLLSYFPNINKESSNICGYITTYDEVDKRIVITKKDYIPKNKDIKYDGNSFKDGEIIIFLEDEKYFYNRSFTMSFKLGYGWVSFHSYIPDLYLSLKNGFYATVKNKIYKFNDISSRALFFETQFPCAIEFIVNNLYIKTLYNNIILSTVAEEYDIESNTFKYLHSIGYNQILIYNEKQCSGIIELYEKNENGELGVKKLLDNNIIHLFRDLISDTSKPIFIKNNTVDFRYSDKNLNTECIDTEKNWYDKSYFKSKTLHIKFILNKFDGIKITTDLSVVNMLPHTKY